jgi:hypothetical protein
MEFPKRNLSAQTGRVGETYFQYFVAQELGWIFRPVHREDDFGIDGYIDIVEDEKVTGRSLAVQIKCGDSYLERTAPSGWKYEGTHPHLNLYLNVSVPVVLVILSSDCQRGYWVIFDLGQTSPSGQGWWIEVPEKNRLTKDVATVWRHLAGPLHDYSQQVQEYWAFNELLKDIGLFVVAIPRVDVKRKTLQTIKFVLDRISKNNELTLGSRNKVEIIFPEYQNDPRELFQIPAVCAWFKHSIKEGIPWFYFLNTRGNCPSLTLLYGCGCKISIIKKIDTGFYFGVSKKERKRWLEQNFHNLNMFTEERSISEDVNRLTTEQIMEKYFSKMDDAEHELKR